jgi:hypothetical protein
MPRGRRQPPGDDDAGAPDSLRSPDSSGWRDPYEAHADRVAAEHATGGPRTDQRAEAEAPDLLRAPPRRVGRKILAGFAFLLFLQQVAASRKPPAPDLAANCTTPSFALSTHSVKQARPLTYTIVGPDGGRFVLGVDTASFVPQPDGGWAAVPLPGGEDSYEVAAPAQPMKGCRRTGLFALPVRLGAHVVTLFELRGSTAVEIQREPITVTDR